MTYDEFLEAQKTQPQRKKQGSEEHDIQCRCVKWFRMQYPELAYNLCAIPNGGRRSQFEGAWMKAEGMTKGAADLILFVPNVSSHALCIEMKTRVGKQRETQKEWQKAVERFGYQYVVCRSFEAFCAIVKTYLKESKYGK